MLERSRHGIPPFSENAVLKLIIIQGVCYIMYHLTRVILMIADVEAAFFTEHFTGNLAMPAKDLFLSKFWTVITYGWIHGERFWTLFTNMVWLYAFGSLVQMLIGYRQVIPIFFYSIIVGGIFYQISLYLPGGYFTGREFMIGANAGLVGLAVAALTLSPGYKFYIGEAFKIPLAVIAIIFFGLQLLYANVNVEGAPLFSLIGGAVMGYLYIVLLRNGYKPADWIYSLSEKVQRPFEPNEETASIRRNVKRGKVQSMYQPKPKQGITQNRIDEILDKINLKGYDSLSKEEKEILMKAGQQKDN